MRYTIIESPIGDLPVLRDDADRVLRKNFPDSRFLTEGLAAATRPWWKLW